MSTLPAMFSASSTQVQPCHLFGRLVVQANQAYASMRCETGARSRPIISRNLFRTGADHTSPRGWMQFLKLDKQGNGTQNCKKEGKALNG